MKAKRLYAAYLVAAMTAGYGQTTIDLRTQGRNIDFSAAGSTKPAKTGLSLPGSCTAGEMFLLRSATPTLYGCSTVGSWVALGPGATFPSFTGNAGKVLSTDGSAAQWKAIGGDATGFPESFTVTGLQGRAVASTAPTNGYALRWNSTTSQWSPGADAISSVFGRTGAVTAQSGDYSFPQISGTLGMAQGGTGATNATQALTNLGAAAAAHTHTLANISGITGKNGNAGVLQAFGGGPVNGNDCAQFDTAGNIVSSGAPCGSTGGVTSAFGRTGGVTAQNGDYSFSQISGTLGVMQGGTGATTAAQALSNLGAAAVAHTHPLTNITGITGKTGDTGVLQTFGGGSPKANDCAQFDAAGNIVSSGAPCGSGSSFPDAGGQTDLIAVSNGTGAEWRSTGTGLLMSSSALAIDPSAVPLLGGSNTFTQPNTFQNAQVVSGASSYVDYTNAGYTAPVRALTSSPATCQANKELVINTTDGHMYRCNAAGNGWTPLDYAHPNSTYWTSGSSDLPVNGVNLGLLTNGLLAISVSGGVATPSTYGIVTTIGNPGSDSTIATEKAVRSAITASVAGVSHLDTTSPLSGGPITSAGTISCPTCIVGSSPGAGLAYFAGSTQTVSTGDLSGDVITSGSTATTLALKYKKRACTLIFGDPGASSPVLADDNDSPNVCPNDWGGDWTITSVACIANAGTPTVNPILKGGSATSILSSAITCGTSWTPGTMNGSPVVHSFSADGVTCSSTPCSIDANISTAGGTARYIVLKIVGTL